MDSRDRLFAEIAVRLELLNREQVTSCSQALARKPGRSFAALAVELGFMSQDEAELCKAQEARVLERQRNAKAPPVPLVEERVERVQKADPRADSSAAAPSEAAPSSPRRRGRDWAPVDAKGAASPRTLDAPLPAGVEPASASTSSVTAPTPPRERADTSPGVSEDEGPTHERPRVDRRSAQGVRDTAPSRADTAPAKAPTDPGRASSTLIGAGPAGPALSSGLLSEPPTAPLPRTGVNRTVNAPGGVPAELVPPPVPSQGPVPPPAKAVTGSGTLLTHASASPEPPAWTEPASGTAGPQPAPAESYLGKAIALAQRNRANDLHISAEAPVMMRVGGQLKPLSGTAPLGLEAAEKILAEVMSDAQWTELTRLRRLSWTLDVPGIARCRAIVHREPRRLDAALRILPWRALTLEELGLPAQLASLAELGSGLVLFSGPSGGGKTSTLAAVLSLVIGARRAKVLTLEDPIELVLAPGQALVHQRQAGQHFETMASGLRAALREDPDVVAVGELDDRETLGLALSAAEGGRLVLAALPGGSALRTLAQVVSLFAELERTAVQRALAESLRAVVSQKLVTPPQGRERVVSVELLLANDRVADQIRRGELEALPVTTFSAS